MQLVESGPRRRLSTKTTDASKGGQVVVESQSIDTLSGARDSTTSRFGYWSALATTALTVVSFALAITAVPDRVPYPFTSHVIAEQWPSDYLWMYPAMVLMVAFVALVAAIHGYAPPARKIYSLVGLCIASVAAGILLMDYYVQVTVMQPSLEKGQLDGWAMLTMYNPHGVFIALEEIGYLLMGLVFVCLAAVFVQRNRLERSIRWLFTLSFAAASLALIVVAATRGIYRGDRFEIVVISVVWLTLIAAGPLLAVVFRRVVSAPSRSA
jgi:hypothetical protein